MHKNDNNTILEKRLPFNDRKSCPKLTQNIEYQNYMTFDKFCSRSGNITALDKYLLIIQIENNESVRLFNRILVVELYSI